MSSLIFYTSESEAFIATDTLATDLNGQPSQFTSKALTVPHLRLVIAGTGLAGFSTEWFARVNDNMVVRGIEHLNEHAPVNLRRMWAGYQEHVAFPDKLTSTIYHFGVSEITEHVCAFAFRSEDDFVAEPIRPGLRVKPEALVPDQYELPLGLIEIMESQRSIQASKPFDERVHIGGELQVIQISSKMSIGYCLHKFDDLEDQQRVIYDNFSNQ